MRSYDVSDMLTSINDTAPSGTIYANSITIDAAGRTTAENETTPAQPFTAPTAVSVTYDADNRLATVNGTAVTFDADGNMLSGPAPGTLTNTGYSYSARNQLIEAGGFAYTYGVLGNRIGIQSPLNSFTKFVVDPQAALDRVLSRTVSGSTGVSTTYYVYGLGLIGEETNGAYAAYHFDTRGSTVALTDINANLTDSFSYGPYGELNNHTGSSTTPFQYNGQFGIQTDPNGLLYMRARYYNPAIRRFINQDVLFGNLDPGISLNRFAFANGNPVSLMDPFGLCSEDIASLNRFYADNTAFTNADVLPGMSFQNKFVTYGDEFYIDPGNFILTAGGGYTVYQSSTRTGLQDVTFDLLNLLGMTSGVEEGLSALKSGIEAIAADTGTQATVDLYRAVSPAELNDIMSTGTFRSVPGAFEGKQFGLSLADTIKFADATPDTAAVIKATIPRSTFQQLEFSTNIDPFIFKNGVITAQPGAQMNLLNSTVISITHAF